MATVSSTATMRLNLVNMDELPMIRPSIRRSPEDFWTGAGHLRHTKFVALREDKDPRKVVRET